MDGGGKVKNSLSKEVKIETEREKRDREIIRKK